MSLVNLVVGHRQELGLCPLPHWLPQERSWVRTCGSVSQRTVVYVGSPFSRELWDLSNSVGASRKVATYGDHPQEAYAKHMWIGVGSVHVILVRFSPVGCTSIRIVMILGYEEPLVCGSHHVDNLMA
jgi:hypothetical protein